MATEEKHLKYFKFRPDKWLSGLISSQPEDVQGVFALVCCHYWIRNCDVTMDWLKKKLKNNHGQLDALAATGVMAVDMAEDGRPGRVRVPFLDGQWAAMDGLAITRSSAGRKGAVAKAQQTPANAIYHTTQHNTTPKVSGWARARERAKASESVKAEIRPPTLEEWTAYFAEHGYPATLAKRSWHSYADAEPPWTDSRGVPVRGWKQKVQQVWFRDPPAPTAAQPGQQKSFNLEH